MKNQRGLTFLGMLFTIAAVVVIALFVMRITPVYIEHYAVTRALSSLQSMPNKEVTTDPAANAIAIKRTLMKQFEIDNVDFIKEDDITITPSGNDKLKVSIHYQVTRPLVANISLIFNFNDSQEVAVGSE